MNERINQLAEEAGIAIWGDAVYMYHPTDTLDSDTLKKFAELIVKECVGIVDKIVPPGYADYPDYRDQIENAFRRECAIEIKKHFGVEE